MQVTEKESIDSFAYFDSTMQMPSVAILIWKASQ